MKRIYKLLLFFIIFIVLSVQPSLAKTVYYDTYGHWAESDIDFATNTLAVFRGYDDFTFRPEKDITRSEFITILAKTAYKQNKMNEIYTSDMAYDDMSNEHWSHTFVISMYEYFKTNSEYTFTKVFPGEYFYPDRAITRNEAVALIAAFCKDHIYDDPVIFKDVSPDYIFYNQIKRLSNSGIITGYEDNTFRGENKITRAESAALIKRVYNDIKTGSKENYLTKLEFLPISGEDMYSYFGNYDLNTTDSNDRKYLKAKDTLEYVSFGGYIFPEDAYLYDLNAVETMASLRENGYYNIAGTNFYLITFGKFTDDEKTQFANEILANIIARNDLKDSEYMQLFTIASKYNVKENLFMDALKVWYNSTSNTNSKANILFFRYAYYIRNNNEDILKTLIFDDLKKSNNIPSLLDMNWNTAINEQTIDFKNYSFGKYSFYLYRDMTLSDYISNLAEPLNDNTKLVQLNKLLIVENSQKMNYSDLADYENIFCRYSLNKLYVLNFIGEKERAFVEGLNDYNIVKSLKVYNTNKQHYDNTYTGILKKVKF